VDSGFDQNQSKLGITILSVTLQVLADRDGLLDELVEIFRNLWGESIGLQDTLKQLL
jgi:hypothetical protein